jgi:hypothetical protein
MNPGCEGRAAAIPGTEHAEPVVFAPGTRQPVLRRVLRGETARIELATQGRRE